MRDGTPNWTEQLPNELLHAAYRATEGNELAWSRADAVRVLNELFALRITVLGVEVWLPTKPGPTVPTEPYYGIDINSAAGLNESAPDSIRKALRFVEEFDWHAADDRNRDAQPYFNFTVDWH